MCVIWRAQVNLGCWSPVSHSYETGAFLLTATNTRLAGLGFQAFPTSASHRLLEPGVQRAPSGFYICTRDLTSTPQACAACALPTEPPCQPLCGISNGRKQAS